MKPATLLVAALLAAGCHVILPLGGASPDVARPVEAGGPDLDAGPTDGPAPDGPVADLIVGADIHRSWQQVFSPDAGTAGPGRLHYPVAVYHQSRGAVWLYGGTDGNGNTSDALWEYRSATGWNQLCGGSMLPCGPGPRTGHAMVYDTKRDRVLLHGGVKVDNAAQPGLTELWVWQSGSLTATPGPAGPALTNAFAAYDEDRDAMVLYGGQSNQANNTAYVLGDLYELHDDQWIGPIQADPAPTPRSSYVHSMTYVPPVPWTGSTPVGRTVLCGGTRFEGSPWQAFDDCWAWDGKTWHELCDACTGTGRMAAGLVFDWRAARLLLVGGYNGALNGEIPGTWSTDNGVSWTQVDVLPTRRDTMAIVYDRGLDRVLLHGGNGPPCSDGMSSPSYHNNCGDTLLYIAGP